MKKLVMAAALGGVLTLGSMLPGVSSVVSTPTALAAAPVNLYCIGLGEVTGHTAAQLRRQGYECIPLKRL